jgi:hypothetical protein
MTQRSKEKQQNGDEDDIEKNPSSTFFSDTTFKMVMSNSMEWRKFTHSLRKGISLRNMIHMPMIWLILKDLNSTKLLLGHLFLPITTWCDGYLPYWYLYMHYC